MAEQAGIDVQSPTISLDRLRLLRERTIESLGEYVTGLADVEAIERQVRDLKDVQNQKSTQTYDALEEYKASVLAAVESELVSGKDLVQLYIDYSTLHKTYYRNSMSMQKDDLLQQYDAMQPGQLVALPIYHYGADEHFDYYVYTIEETPSPVILEESSGLVLGYKFISEDTDKKFIRNAHTILVGKDVIVAQLEKAVEAQLKKCTDAHRSMDKYTIDLIMSERNKLIDIAEQLGREDLVTEIKVAKSNLAIVMLENDTEEFHQTEYTNAARYLLTHSIKEFYQTLGNTIAETENILRRIPTAHCKIFAALYYAHLPEEATRYSFSEKEYLEAAAWFAKQHDLLEEAEFKAKQKENDKTLYS